MLRDGKFIDIPKKQKTINHLHTKRNKLYQYNFSLQKEDRIILVSDGITQSGMGSDEMHFGLQINGLKKHIQKTVSEEPGISAKQLAQSIMNKAINIDKGALKDDASCCVLYYRKPRKLLIVSGPPYHKENDVHLARSINQFRGKTIICGGTTAKIVARELDTEVEIDLANYTPGLPPRATMKGIDLVTEGVITLARVSEELQKYDSNAGVSPGISGQIISMMLESDEIHFISGTRINNAHQDPNLPVELEIRRNVIKRITETLEKKFLKITDITYL